MLSTNNPIKDSTLQDQLRTYGFPPLLCKEPRILILGTLPGGESLEHRQYYYSDSNRIWKVLCYLTGEPMPASSGYRRPAVVMPTTAGVSLRIWPGNGNIFLTDAYVRDRISCCPCGNRIPAGNDRGGLPSRSIL